MLYRPLRDVDGIEFRLHRTVLYNSIYRADDQLLVNTHIYGFAARRTRPVLHLRAGRRRRHGDDVPGQLRARLGRARPRWSEATGVARRIDFYDDPEAPQREQSSCRRRTSSSTNDAGEILLIRRTDNDNWALPGGAMDLGESLPDAAVRETAEETGIDVEITGLVGIYTDPRHVILYTSNGEVRQEFSVVFAARPVGGTPTPSDESREVRWVAPAAIATLPMDRSMRHAARPLPRPRRRTSTLDSDWLSAGADVFSAVGTVGAFLVGFLLLRREHRREADRAEDERRAQAERISAWVEAYRKPDGSRELAFHIHNASAHADLRGRAAAADPSATRSRAAEFVGLVPPGQTIQRAAPADWLRSYVDPEPVQIEFLDSAGRRWSRDEQGSLSAQTG